MFMKKLKLLYVEHRSFSWSSREIQNGNVFTSIEPAFQNWNTDNDPVFFKKKNTLLSDGMIRAKKTKIR